MAEPDYLDIKQAYDVGNLGWSEAMSLCFLRKSKAESSPPPEKRAEELCAEPGCGQEKGSGIHDPAEGSHPFRPNPDALEQRAGEFYRTWRNEHPLRFADMQHREYWFRLATDFARSEVNAELEAAAQHFDKKSDWGGIWRDEITAYLRDRKR